MGGLDAETYAKLLNLIAKGKCHFGINRVVKCQNDGSIRVTVAFGLATEGRIKVVTLQAWECDGHNFGRR